MNHGEGYINIHLGQTRFILIVSGRYGAELVPRIHQYPSIIGNLCFLYGSRKKSSMGKEFSQSTVILFS